MIAINPPTIFSKLYPILTIGLMMTGCVLPASVAPLQTAELNNGYNPPARDLTSNSPLVLPRGVETDKTQTPFIMQTQPASPSISTPVVVTPLPLNLAGFPAGSQTAITGMAWFSDTLVLLPQFPDLNAVAGQGAVFGIPRAVLQNAISERSSQAIELVKIPFLFQGIKADLPNSVGFHSLAFSGSQVFSTVLVNAGITTLYLVKGQVSQDLKRITLGNRVQISSQSDTKPAPLFGSILMVAGKRIVLFETGIGSDAKASISAALYDFSLTPQGIIPFPHLESYLISVSSTDAQGSFWGLSCVLPTKAENNLMTAATMEEFHFTEYGIERTESPQLLFKLSNPSAHCPSGLERLGIEGYLVVDPNLTSGLRILYIPKP